MSRIGKKPIAVPKNVVVTINNDMVTVKGPKGTLSRRVHKSMVVSKGDNVIEVNPKDAADPASNFHGLTRSLLSNMVTGVSEGFSKSLLLKGVGYRAAIKGKELQLTLGYSHPVNYIIPTGLNIQVDKQTTIIIDGADKEQVGQSAAEIRAYRKPEPYHGKGVRYIDEVVVTKAGKASGKK